MEINKTKYHGELREIAPKLSEIEKKDAFSVPDDYFTNLSNRINERIASEDAEQRKLVPAVLMRYLSAAVFSVLILAIIFIYINRKENTTLTSETKISADDLIASAYLLAVDEVYIKESVAYGEAELNNIFVDNSEFEEYLLDYGIDENLITKEL